MPAESASRPLPLFFWFGQTWSRRRIVSEQVIGSVAGERVNGDGEVIGGGGVGLVDLVSETRLERLRPARYQESQSDHYLCASFSIRAPGSRKVRLKQVVLFRKARHAVAMWCCSVNGKYKGYKSFFLQALLAIGSDPKNVQSEEIKVRRIRLELQA